MAFLHVAFGMLHVIKPDVSYMICAWLGPSHFKVYAVDRSLLGEEIVKNLKNLKLRFSVFSVIFVVVVVIIILNGQSYMPAEMKSTHIYRVG